MSNSISCLIECFAGRYQPLKQETLIPFFLFYLQMVGILDAERKRFVKVSLFWKSPPFLEALMNRSLQNQS